MMTEVVMQKKNILLQNEFQPVYIWDSFQDDPHNTYTFFRKELTLPAAMSCHVMIAAETRYELYLNGKYQRFGQLQCSPQYKYYDHFELKLPKGHNCIGIIVHCSGHKNYSPPSLAFELRDHRGRALLTTGDNWKCRRSEAWIQDTFYFHMNKYAPWQEHFDSNKYDPAWCACGYDDSRWNDPVPCAVDKVPERLLPRTLEYYNERKVFAEKIYRIDESIWLANRAGKDICAELSAPGKELEYAVLECPEAILTKCGKTVISCSTRHLTGPFDGVYEPTVVLDFGRVVRGFVEFEFAGLDGGEEVLIGYAERLIDGYFNNAIEGNFATKATLRSGKDAFRARNWRTFRYIKVRFRKFYSPAKLNYFRINELNYPFEQKGVFKASDKKLEKIFEISRSTVNLCALDGLYDTPQRETAQWLGDVALIGVPAIYACYGDTVHPEKFLRQAAANQWPGGILSNLSNLVAAHGGITDYSLHWLNALHEHYMYTGNKKIIRDLYATAVRIIDNGQAFLNSDGLIEERSGWVFIDWAYVDNKGISASYNALFAGALLSMEKIAEIYGDAYYAKKCKEVYDGIKKVFDKTFYDAKKKCYIDAVYRGKRSGNLSEHSNYTPIRYGLCTKKRAKEVIDTVYGSKWLKFREAQPFYMKIVLEALQLSGRMDLAIKLIRERWGKRMVDRGRTSCTEEWGENGSWRGRDYSGFLRTHSHAWSGCCAEFLIRHLAGLEFVDPGAKTLKIVPYQGDFDYSISYPVPSGLVTVEYQDGKLSCHASDGITLVQDK